MEIDLELFQGRLPGHLQVIGYLAQGGSADVLSAFDTLRGQQVVIKISRDPATMGTWIRNEGEALKHIPPHEGIVGLLDHDPNGMDPFHVLEHVPGLNFEEWLKSHAGRVTEAVRLVGLTASIVAEAVHGSDFVHADLKPANIIIVPGDSAGMNGVKVIDFGVSRRRGYKAPLSAGQQLTPNYAAPEAIWPSSLWPSFDFSRDVYSLGVVLYEACMGVLPFVADTVMATCYHHLTTPAPLLMRPDGERELPKALQELCAVMLSKNPSHRPSMADVAIIIGRCAKDLKNTGFDQVPAFQSGERPTILAPTMRFPVISRA